MQKIWKILKPNPNHVALQQALSVDRIVSSLLSLRGINNFEDAKTFFRPDLNQLHDPYLMKDMDKAIARIKTAISKNEKVLIYGDYDVDGTTAVSIVYSFFKQYIA
ncbi:MAG: single-stranded-DNA-specific exonuclease RecJ, partial [Bacteroidota bacterium]